jgi:uncharacterized membrane protein HdeD (DUF308 family)
MLSGATLAMPSTLNRVGCTAFFTACDQQHGRFPLGLLECLDAALAKETRDLQVGCLDTVIGAMIILRVTEELSRLSMTIATFFNYSRIVRIPLVYALQFSHTVVTLLGGLLPIITGFLIWKQRPAGEG